MSWGEWLGTHWLFSVFRSTSQSCSQSSLCAGAADCNHSVSDTIGLVASRLAELHTEGYSLVGMKRDQDHLSMVDPARLHGFVILKMTSSDSSIRYMRLDWGENGLGFQEQDTEEALMTYMENKESEERESSVGVRTGAGAVAGTTALGALAWWATALTPSGAVGAAVIGVSVVVVWASGLVWLDAEDDHIHADFQGVDDQDEALRRLYKELRTLQREGHAYSLTSWNNTRNELQPLREPSRPRDDQSPHLWHGLSAAATSPNSHRKISQRIPHLTSASQYAAARPCAISGFRSQNG